MTRPERIALDVDDEWYDATVAAADTRHAMYIHADIVRAMVAEARAPFIEMLHDVRDYLDGAPAIVADDAVYWAWVKNQSAKRECIKDAIARALTDEVTP